MAREIDGETGYYLSREQEDREVHKAWVALVVWLLALLLVGSMDGADRERIVAPSERDSPPMEAARG